MSDGASWGDSKEYKEVQTRASRNPFADISDPATLRALVQDGVKCEECEGSGQMAVRIEYYEEQEKCTDCHASGHIPLSNADLDALAACWCEGEWLDWDPQWDPHKGLWKIWNSYYSWWSISEISAYTTDPVAAMRLRIKYNISTYRWNNRKSWMANANDCNVGRVDENPCRAETEAAVIAALEIS